MDLGTPGGAPENTASSAGEGKEAEGDYREGARNEFTFHTARNAAEFQHVVLALQTAGRDVACL